MALTLHTVLRIEVTGINGGLSHIDTGPQSVATKNIKICREMTVNSTPGTISGEKTLSNKLRSVEVWYVAVKSVRVWIRQV